MPVSDRWHREPKPGDEPCKCGRGRQRLYPSAQHLKGKRWQVRWDDPNAPKRRQPSRNFALRDPAPGELADRNKHASAFDKEIQGSIVRDDYADPNAGNVTLQAYAEEFRKSRTHGESAATGLESRLRNHVYEDPARPGSGRTPKGGVSIGQHPMGLLGRRPSLTAAWAASIPLADGSKGLVMGDVSSVFQAAVEDGVARANPVQSSSVGRPPPPPTKAQPYAAGEMAGIRACLPGRFKIMIDLGAVTGTREMEMAGLGADDIIRGKRPKVRVVRQLKAVDGRLRFGPIKNRKHHDVPVPKELLDALDEHMRHFPPVTVTLPWHEPGAKFHGTMVTVRLLLSRGDGTPATRNVLDSAWRPAAGRMLAPKASERRRRALAKGHGMHRMRHTAASHWLRDGIDVVRVAAWLGDTVEMVTTTYAHLLPDDEDGEDAGRASSAAFLGACARSVRPEGSPAASGLVAVV